MNVKTRGNSISQGKPRVYYIGHAVDVERYFDAITEMILQKVNCAIYYNQPDEVCSLEDLSRMQLIVLVVTRRFLYEENDAYNIVFKNAIEMHIPVLPILEEKLSSAEEKKLNEMLGDLQCLDPNSNNPTELNFDEKLSRFLNSILLGDEMLEKIRDAFDAYIFLSYRKKDRAYTNELIQLIHSNEFTRDIAIWFDEFLVPGENFNDAIKDALNKSDLFALAVTPNLVNEENYIQSVEYPMAVKCGKTILPIEMVKTDEESLFSQYKNIPKCVSAKNQQGLSDSLFQALKKIVIKENNHDPQHNFFIGLAYLAGIDVEKNEKQAEKMITEAAENGLLEAMKKLAIMYRFGEGVKRDSQKAINWYKKVINVLKKQYEQTENGKDGSLYLAASRELAKYLFELEDINQAKNVYLKILEESKRMNSKFNSLNSMTDEAVCYMELGDIFDILNDLEKEESCYLEAMELFEQLLVESCETELSGGVEIETALGKKVENRIKSTVMLNKLQTYQIPLKSRAEFARYYISIFNRISNVALKKGQRNLAEGYADTAFAVARKLSEETKAIEDKKAYSSVLVFSGNIEFAYKEYGKAREYFGESMRIYRDIYEERKDTESKRDLYVSLYKLGEAYKEGAKHKKEDEKETNFILRSNKFCVKSYKYYIEALQYAKELDEELDNTQTKVNLAMCYSNISGAYHAFVLNILKICSNDNLTFSQTEDDIMLNFWCYNNKSIEYYANAMITLYSTLENIDIVPNYADVLKIYESSEAEITKIFGWLETQDRKQEANFIREIALLIKENGFMTNKEKYTTIFLEFCYRLAVINENIKELFSQEDMSMNGFLLAHESQQETLMNYEKVIYFYEKLAELGNEETKTKLQNLNKDHTQS